MKQSIIDTSVQDPNAVYHTDDLLNPSATPEFNLINVRTDGTAGGRRRGLLHEPLCRCFPGLLLLDSAGWLWDDAGAEAGWDLTGNVMPVEALRGANARDCGNLRSLLVCKMGLR